MQFALNCNLRSVSSKPNTAHSSQCCGHHDGRRTKFEVTVNCQTVTLKTVSIPLTAAQHTVHNYLLTNLSSNVLMQLLSNVHCTLYIFSPML